MIGKCVPIRPSGPNGTSGLNNNQMTPKLGKYNVIGSFVKGAL